LTVCGECGVTSQFSSNWKTSLISIPQIFMS
jgi:hypothetical protein